MIEINLNNDTLIYKSKIDFNSNFEKSLFINKLKMINSLVPTSNQPSQKTPGRQSILSDVHMSELSFIKESILNLIANHFNKNNDFIVKLWVYYSDRDNMYTGYHTHTTLDNTLTNPFDKMKTDYTFTYYLQMPDKLKNDEGKLFFKTNDGKEIGILPEEDDVFVFPSDLEHKPQLNPNSTKSRIVIAGNVIFLDNHLKKTQKSFI